MNTHLNTVCPGGLVLGSLIVLTATAVAQHPGGAARHVNSEGRGNGVCRWHMAESTALQDHVQLTFPSAFQKAGEGYFDTARTRVIFQAIPVPEEGEAPDAFYTMYLAELASDGAGRITGLENVRRISPPGSANTCGWFDPNELAYVYFGSTIEPPTEHEAPGYQHGSGRYKWAFPATMRIVRHDLNEPAGDATSLTIMAGDDQSYQAEDALSPDGRHLVYCSLESGDGDLYIKDLRSGQVARVVTKPGYDGGPFFSPDGRRLCYRSDRRGDNLLQLFVAELAFDENGSVIGIDREYQLTDNRHVNWAPYWHPGGRHLVYGSSELGHHNYEVFIIDADPGDLPGSTGTIKYGTGKRRLTHADGADIMPTFSADGEYLTWTSQRGASGTSQLWAARFIMPLEARLQDTSGGAAVRGVDGQAASSGGAPKRGGVGEGDPRLSG